MTDYKAIAASLRACTDPQKRYAADVIDALAGTEEQSGITREAVRKLGQIADTLPEDQGDTLRGAGRLIECLEMQRNRYRTEYLDYRYQVAKEREAQVVPRQGKES